jgi:hypothetical protein
MTGPTRLRAALIVAVVLLARLAAAQIVAENKLPLENRIDCVISAVEANWRNNADTLIHIRLKNRTDETLETEFNATLYLTPDSKVQPVPFWSPIDLAHDMPAPTDRKQSGRAVSIKLKMQSLRITPRGESEFTIHAANVKWQREISSIWPDLDLMKIAPVGGYSLKLVLDTQAGSMESNTIKVAIVKK